MDASLFNAPQREAIDHNFGPMLVVAGAGTGKTSVLVERVSRIVLEGMARPEEILAVTYTLETARNIQQRILARLTKSGKRGAPEVTTFHAYCDRLLKRYGRSFDLVTGEDLWIYLRQNIAQLGLKQFIVAKNPGQFLSDLLAFMDRCHDELVDPDRYRGYVADVRAGVVAPQRTITTGKLEEIPPQEQIARCEEIAAVFTKVQAILRKKNWGTFGMQIADAAGLLQENHSVLRNEQSRTRFILIDEFQDANAAQIVIAKLLSGTDQNVFAVGDPDQAIYRFRGASSAAFEEFLRCFPKSRGVILDENYRSLSPILACGFAAIKENSEINVPAGMHTRFGRIPLQAVRDRHLQENLFAATANPVEVVVADSSDEEAVEIAGKIKALHLRYRKARGKFDSPAFAVLYRSHKQRSRIIQELSACDIPFLVTGVDAFDSPEVRDLLAVLRVIENPFDSLSLLRVSAFPQFGVPAAILRQELDKSDGAPLKLALRNVTGGDRVLAEIESATSLTAKLNHNLPQVLPLLVKQFSLDPNSEAVRAFLDFARAWRVKPTTVTGTVAEFLQYMSYFREANGSLSPVKNSDQESDPLAVRLMTVHGAKGLEFRHVFVLRVQPSSFPVTYREPLVEFPAELRSALAPKDGRALHGEEERRLFYVAMTRAQDTLAIYARPGRGKGQVPTGLVRPLFAHQMRGHVCIRLKAAATDPPARAQWQEASGVGAWLLIPPRAKLGSMALSAGAIESYELCPLRFKLERDWKLPGEISAALNYGNAVHTVLKQYFDPLYETSVRTVAEVHQAFLKEIAKTRFDDPVQERLYVDLGKEQLTEFVRKHAHAVSRVLGTEIPFAIEIRGIKVVGRMDRVDLLGDSKVAIVDYKTGRVKRQQEADSSLQLSIYAMAAREGMKYIPQRLEFYNLETNQAVATSRTPEQMITARERVIKVAEAIQRERFDPNPDRHCNWCAFQNLCPATEQRIYSTIKSLKAVS